MAKTREKKRSPRGVLELWLAPVDPQQPELPGVFYYQPAVMFECFVEFRDVRAEIIHAKEEFYTAWLPEGDEDVAIDWSAPAVEPFDPTRLETEPRTAIRRYEGQVKLSPKRMEAAQADLIDHLVRHQSLRLFYNPYLKWYSKLNEGQHEFRHRVMEETLTQLQPRLKELARRLQLQVEQLREKPLSEDVAGDSAEDLEAVRRRMIDAIESKVDALIMGHPEPLSKPLLSLHQDMPIPDEIKGTKEELDRIEQEIFDDLNALLTEYTSQARECQEYEIKLQPTDIKIIRRALLWVPV